MEIRLSPELEAKVTGAVASGRYGSAEEYIAEAVTQFDPWHPLQYETAEELNALLEEGLADVEAGNLISMEQCKEEMGQMKAEWARHRQPA